MKSIDGFGVSFVPVTALALLFNVLLAGECSAGTGAIHRAGADTTDPGPGTGLFGAGKGPSPVLLGKAGDYAILAKTGISTTGATAITGNIGVSPVAASYITGFSLLDPPGAYATSAAVTGKVYAADYDSPTPANLTTAVLDMQTAYTDAAARAPDYTELGAGDIGGMTLAPAVYKWSTDLLIPSDVTLLGGPYDVWIFEIAGDLTQTSGVRITLQGGALSKNIFWQVAGASTHETTSHFEGILLSQTAIVMKTGATAKGRQLAQTNVALDANTVTQPDISVEPGTATLRIKVSKSDDSSLIPAASVVLKRGSVIIDSAGVDSIGECHFSNLPVAGNYSIVASAPDFFPTMTTFQLAADATRTLTVRLVPKDPTSLYRKSADRSGAIHFAPAGDRLAVDAGISSVNRSLSIFGANGILKHRVSIPAGQTRTLIPISLSPLNGYLYKVK
ncbi:MAG: ice-binding family protein [Fibrobacteria bacterium]